MIRYAQILNRIYLSLIGFPEQAKTLGKKYLTKTYFELF